MALPDIITVEDLFGSPERTGASISVDGKRIAYLAPRKNRLNVWVQSVDSDEEARCVTADENRSVVSYEWTDDPRWLLYLQDSGGNENWHLYRVNLDDPDAAAVDLTPFPGVRVWRLDLPVGRPGKAILQLNARNVAEIDLHELDIATGELTLLAQNPGQVYSWLCAPNGDLFAQPLTDTGDIELSRWDSATATLRSIVVWDGSDYPLSISPFTLTPDGAGLWLGSNRGTNRTRLARLDLSTALETEVDSHPTLDLTPAPYPSLISHPHTGELRGVRYLGERQVIHALDPHFSEVLDNLEELSDDDLAEVSSDHAGQRWVVSFTYDRDPGVTWFYDHVTGESRHEDADETATEGHAPAQTVDLAQAVLDGLGGPWGMVYSALLVVVFVTVLPFVSLPVTVGVAIAVALALAVFRILRGERFRSAIGGMIGVSAAGGVVAWTGSANDFFLIGIWASLAGALLTLASVLMRRPLTGVVWNAVHGGQHPWRADRTTLHDHDLATLALTALFAARFVVKEWLYLADSTGGLAFAKVSMGTPLLALTLLVVIWAFRRSTRRFTAPTGATS